MNQWTDDQLIEHALETLASSESVQLALDLRDDVALQVRLAEIRELVGVLPIAFDASPADSVSAPTDAHAIKAAVDRLLVEVAAKNRFAFYADKVMALLGLDHDSALNMLAGLDEPKNWRRGILPGILMWPIPSGKECVSVVWLKIPAGTEFPHHEHLGDEAVLMVQGHHIDDEGKTHLPGSILRESTTTSHSFRIGGDGPDCICLAVVTNGIRMGDDEVSPSQIYRAALH